MNSPTALRFLPALAVLLLLSCSDGHDSSDDGPGLIGDFLAVPLDPASGATGVELTVYPVLYFSDPVDPLTLTPTSVTIAIGSNPALPAALVYDAAYQRLRIEPSSPLAASTAYTIRLTSAILNEDGNDLTPYQYLFTTGAYSDSTRPVFAGVTSATVHPDDGGTVGVDESLAQIDLSWTQATDNVTAQALIKYDVWYDATPAVDVDSAPPFTFTGVSGGTVTGLSANTDYYFVVRARDESDNRSLNLEQATAKTNVSWVANVWPFIYVSCSQCHTDSAVPPPGYTAVPDMPLPNSFQAYQSWEPGVKLETSGAPSFTYRIVAGNASQSFVYHKISDTTPEVGAFMAGEPPLTSAQVLLFYNWIQQGAKDN